MVINVIRLRTILDDREEIVKKEDDQFLDEINTELIEEDILLKENAENAICDLYFVETGGSEPHFVKLFPDIDKNEPILLLSNCRNNSLPASLEINTYCSRNNASPILFAGLEASNIAKHIKAFFHIYTAKKSLDDNNLGVIGEPSPWLIASGIEKDVVKDKCNINLIDISMEELFEEIDKKEMVKIPHEEELKNKFKNQEVLIEALYFYSALKRIVKKHNLQGLTIRCFDLLERYKNTACLALALLNEEGITAGCEGDISSLLTMHMIKALTGRPSFMANPSYIKGENNEILFAHCTLPLNMTTDYTLLTHFESNLGIGIKGNMPLGEVSVCKLSLTKNGFFEETLAISGNIKENMSLNGYCRTQILIEFEERDMVNFFKTAFANHVIITYGNIVEDFFGLLSLYQVGYQKD